MTSLRLSAPLLSARIDSELLASTLAKLLGSGNAACKADLVRVTGLSRTTVDTGIRLLLEHSVIRRAGFRQTSGRGRSAELLELSPDYGYVLVADCSAHMAQLGVFDLNQKELSSSSVRYELSEGPQKVLGAIVAEFLRLLDELPHSAVVTVMGLPGPVDNRSGTVVRPPIMPGWDGFPIAQFVGTALECQVVLENDVNLRALGEARAIGPLSGPLLYVKVSTGIGAGIVTANGELMHGADGSAGDIGHIKLASQDRPCVCGNNGCLEAVASAAALTRRMIGAPYTAAVDGADIDRLLERINAGDPEALANLKEAAQYVGEAIANLVHVLNPSRIVIGGMLANAGDDLLATVRGIVYQRALPLATRELTVGKPLLGVRSGMAGGLITGIERALSPDSLNAHINLGKGLENIA
ncbi:ROK family protein [Subtercola frigoramans]|uniref:NBD/HSP70 family sugar kinase n=1 Tax=Subtercola frigoramans TaxID=120298 RepID=A0ABS2L098_9MICO|nr:ROK family protein [Subtercola frigoramans]MBM7470487.1 putative NBD/HSP70 family sugar kinase [Subtercola frigoramans]